MSVLPRILGSSEQSHSREPKSAVLPVTKDGAVAAHGFFQEASWTIHAPVQTEASQHLLRHDLYRVPCCDIALVSSSLFHFRVRVGSDRA